MARTIAVCFIAALALSQTASAENWILEGQQLYREFCADCHGLDAMGGESLGGTPPLDLTAIAERRDLVWPMLEVMSIVDGYTKATEPREGMPIIPELTEGIQIDFDTGNGLSLTVPKNLVAVVTYLESIQMPKPKSYVP